MVVANKMMADERRRLIRQQVITLHAGKVFPHAGYGVVADDSVRKRRASVRICLVLAAGLFGSRVVLYTSK